MAVRPSLPCTRSSTLRKKEILLETYILRDDATGLEMRNALRCAGVAVRVLADGFGSSNTQTAFWNELREEGMQNGRD